MALAGRTTGQVLGVLPWAAGRMVAAGPVVVGVVFALRAGTGRVRQTPRTGVVLRPAVVRQPCGDRSGRG